MARKLYNEKAKKEAADEMFVRYGVSDIVNGGYTDTVRNRFFMCTD